MKKVLTKLLTVVLPFSGLAALFGCSATPTCNNDSCYDRSLSSVDPYKAGDIAAWGTEKDEAQKEQQKDGRSDHGGLR